MEDSLVSKAITINSHKGTYEVNFTQDWNQSINNYDLESSFFIIDSCIAKLYEKSLKEIFKNKYYLIEANEKNKSLEKFPGYIDDLINLGLKRGNKLIAIGGGITQDITCFLASTMFRGLDWDFFPTTLLAQSDSCIGSKSSINSGNIKNILGTFTPPKKIILDVSFLKTLEEKDIYSGIGEMIKVHAINSPESFDQINQSYDKILEDPESMVQFIRASLLFKKRLIELDEFDVGPRNVMNYGHSFGHAIETATNYGIPHGIAVTIGMDMANFVASKLGVTSISNFERMHALLDKNCSTYRKTKIDPNRLLEALAKDKKNTASQLRLILPNSKGEISIGLYEKSNELNQAVEEYCRFHHT